jgi:hypothetical protein
MPKPRFAAAVSPRRHSVETLEDRRLLVAGVTVITHGAQLFGGLPDWTVSMGQAILDRADGTLTGRNVGSMFQHNVATGQWTPVGAAAWTNSNQPADHIVLIYDWSEESATFADGWLEAAADNLFASLLAVNENLGGAVQGTSFLDAALAAGGGGGLLDLHLIGHSRGGVLNSLVAERFDHYFPDLTIDHVTTLDAHPAGPMNDRGYVADNPSANSRVFTYDNVRFADNYFQSDGAYEPIGFDFDGVTATGAYNFQIPSAVLENGGSGLEHSDVHSWYFGTITEPFAVGYAGFSGAGRNHDGDVAFPEAWWGASGVPARNATGFAYSIIGGASREGLPVTGAKIAAGAIATVFDGDMALGSDGVFSDSLPGWESHAGGGSGPLGGGGDLYVELNGGDDDYFRRHNALYFPRHTVAVEFDYWVSDADAVAPDDVLQVIVGGTAIDVLPLATMTEGFVRNRRAAVELPLDGLTATLEFRLHDAAGDGIESAVRFDNVELVIQPQAASADFDVDGDVDGADFLRWQRGLGTYMTATHGEGDANFDGHVLGDDLAAWRERFAMPAGGEMASSLRAGLPDLAVAAAPAPKSRRTATQAIKAARDGALPFAAASFAAPLLRPLDLRDSVHVPADRPHGPIHDDGVARRLSAFDALFTGLGS